MTQRNDQICCAFRIVMNVLCEICALEGDGRYEKGDQPPERDKDDSEKKSLRFRATETASGHFRHERVEQIRQNHCDGDRDQDRLKKADDIGAGPDDCANDYDEKDNKEGAESRPHRLALPGSWIVLHLRIMPSCL